MSATRGNETFRYVNLERRWPDCVLEGVEMEDGVLRLARVPANAKSGGADPGDATALAGPSRIGVGPDGAVYLADPAGHRILRIPPCGDKAEPLPCLRGPGSDPGEVSEPHGVAVGRRNTLYVADTGNARVQLIDLASGQVRGVIGAADPWGDPSPSAAEGRLLAPWDIALDAAGNLYVAEPAATDAKGVHHSGRIQKFDARGRVVPGFWTAMQASGSAPASPVSIVIVATDAGESLLVIDGAPARVLIYSLDGAFDAGASGEWGAFAALVTQPTTATIAGGVLYVADAGTARVLVFSRSGAFLGVARDYSADTIGLALDHDGRLLAQPRAGGLARLDIDGSFAEVGTVVAGPFRHEPGQQHWFRLHLVTEPLPDQAQVQLFTYTRDTAPLIGPGAPVTADGSLVGTVDGHDTPAPTPEGRWRALPPGATTGLILNAPARYVWVAMVLQGNGRATPRVTQLRLDDDASGWLRHLPAIYSRDDDTRAFLDRALALFQDRLEGVEGRLEELVRAIDPHAAPDDRLTASWLEWLSGWLAFPLAESWSERQRRDALAEAFRLEATRGTVESLRRLILLYAGAPVRISEPAVTQRLWALGAGTRLGLDTMLAPADPHGVVLDTTAALDRSHLLPAADEGMPPFAAVANRFCVEAYAADFPTEAARRELVRVIEDEKPAHATWHLCLIEPAMRVGAQARVGIDAIVSGPSGVCFEETGSALTDRSVLTAPDGGTRPARVGGSARVGRGAVIT